MSGSRKETTSARPVGEEPPYLAVGTEVSAKYRGAFCEANIKSVKKLVKCKVNFENGGGNSTVTDDCVTGELKVGSDVKVAVPDGQDMVGTLVKITDSSSYTVVFDDGDERTLKRTSLCIKGEKHFNESETLDHLPLTDPENFGTPVMQQGKKSRKGRRSSLSSLDEMKESDEIPARKKLKVKNDEDFDKVVMVHFTEKKKSFQLPALLLCSTAFHGEVKSPENVIVRSFKDGKYIEVHPRDVKEFSKENAVNSTLIKAENPSLKLAVENAVKYLDTKQLPSTWSEDDLKTEDVLQNKSSDHSSSSEAESDGDENERNKFLEKLTKFLGEKGTPLVRAPVLGHRDLDLYKLFKIVSKMDGMDKVKSWHTVYKKMNIPVITTTASYHIKNAYKRYLYDYEAHAQDEKTVTAKSKKSKNNSKSSNNGAAENSTKEDDMILSDSEKDLKELRLFEDCKIPAQRKTASRRGRGRRKTRPERGKSLKSPSSPALSPMSDPGSPKSFSSISASESTGCPSPAENHCDSRELSGKIDSVLDKNCEKSLAKTEDIKGGTTTELRGKNRESESSKDSLNCKTKMSTSCKDDESDVAVKSEIKDLDVKSEAKDEVNNEVDGDKTNTHATCDGETLVEKNDQQHCNKSEKEICLEKNEEENNVNSVLKSGSSSDRRDLDKRNLDNTVHTSTSVENQVHDGTDVEDAVDVVNSPSGTSETVDSDEQRGERKPKAKKGLGKTAAKSNNVTDDDADDLEYKLNDRIDVRYGRGRNATVYHAKVTYVDPGAGEGLCYLVHYQGWNARHDEWIGPERIIGRDTKQTRTRATKEPAKNGKATPKPIAKPTPKLLAKKNAKNNGAGHVGRPPGSKRKRTPSPTANMVTSSRNGNGRNCKNRNLNEKTLSESAVEAKCPARITRRNSNTIPLETSEQDFVDIKSLESKTENQKDSLPSPVRTQRSCDAKSPSPKRHVEKTSEQTTEKVEKLEDVKREVPVTVEKIEDAVVDRRSEESGPPVEDNKIEVEKKAMKRPREVEEPENSCVESQPAKKKLDGQPVSVKEDLKTDSAKSPIKEAKVTESTESKPMPHDETLGPDLTCSEELPTHCASPDPYTAVFTEDSKRFYGNGLETSGAASKEKDSSSSLNHSKPEKPAPNRRTKCRRDRKTRTASCQSSVDTSEGHNGASNCPTVTVVLSPSWTPKYNFTEDLDELLKNEESSERIRLLTERIKDIRKVYCELKSEVANIDRKRKRKQKRKREEELSTEENTARSPSRSSPLTATTTTAVSSTNSLSAVECR